MWKSFPTIVAESARYGSEIAWDVDLGTLTADYRTQTAQADSDPEARVGHTMDPLAANPYLRFSFELPSWVSIMKDLPCTVTFDVYVNPLPQPGDRGPNFEVRTIRKFAIDVEEVMYSVVLNQAFSRNFGYASGKWLRQAVTGRGKGGTRSNFDLEVELASTSVGNVLLEWNIIVTVEASWLSFIDHGPQMLAQSSDWVLVQGPS